jgi:hypothetical protein
MFYLLALCALTISFAPPAHAYIDACTGSYAVQFFFGTVLTFLLPLQRALRNFLNSKTGK